MRFSKRVSPIIALPLVIIAAACTTDSARAPTVMTRAEDGRRVFVQVDKPRIPPVEDGHWTEAQRAYLEPFERSGRVFDVFKTFARHPDLAKNFHPVYQYINDGASTLPPRHRELLILRIGWLCGSEYEWSVHSYIARTVGFTDDELVRVVTGPDAPGWGAFEATLLRAVDELYRDAFISDATWQALSAQYNTQQLMDLVYTVGTYNMVSMALNSWGVQLEKGMRGFPEEK